MHERNREMRKYEYLPVGDGTVTWEEVNEALIAKISKFDIVTLVERFTSVKHENEKRCIVNRLCEFDASEVNAIITDFKNYAMKSDLPKVDELERMFNS
jgi:hypothetical protein